VTLDDPSSPSPAPGAPESPSSPSETEPSPRASGGAKEPEPAFLCDLCGAPMLDRHCKLLCLRCGYQRDCSDP
jgi:hypothetical protein